MLADAGSSTLLAHTALPPMLADAGTSTFLARTALPPVLTFSSLRWWLLAAVHGASDFHAANALMAGILQLEPTAQPADVRLEPNLGELHTLLLPPTLMSLICPVISCKERKGKEGQIETLNTVPLACYA